MQKILPESLKVLASACKKPLYLVGGAVRDFHLEKLTKESDFDICSFMTEKELISAAEQC